jgi:hypothetical protein
MFAEAFGFILLVSSLGLSSLGLGCLFRKWQEESENKGGKE